MDGVAGDATAQARIETLMEDLLDIIYSGSTEGSRCVTNDRNVHHAATPILRKKGLSGGGKRRSGKRE